MAMAIVVIMTIGIITLLVLTAVAVFVLSVVFLFLVLLFLNLLLHFFFSFVPSSLGLFPAFPRAVLPVKGLAMNSVCAVAL
jgi:hypothetical protein